MAKNVEGAVAETTATDATNATSTETTATAGKKKSTAKSKEALGVPDDHIITWVPFAMNEQDNALLKRVAAAREAALPEGGKYPVHMVLAGIIADGLTTQVKAGWAEEAKNAPEVKTRTKVVISDDPAEAEKQLLALADKAQKNLDRQNEALRKATEALAAARAKMAGNAVASTSTANDESDGAVV